MLSFTKNQENKNSNEGEISINKNMMKIKSSFGKSFWKQVLLFTIGRREN